MIRNWLTLILVTGIIGCSLAQSNIPVGTWRTHNSYNSLVAIATSNSFIYAANANALFRYNPITEDTEQITSISGLNDSQITTIGYNLGTDKLIITYENGNIDFLSENRISNFPELKLADINGSKVIHHIYNYKKFSYLSADFGVMIIDNEKSQVKETFFELGPQGQSIAIYAAYIASDTLYLATGSGVIRGSLHDNLKDYNQWQRYGLADGLPESLVKVFALYGNNLIAAFNQEGLYSYNGTKWQKLNLLTQKDFQYASQDAGITLFTTADSVFQFVGNKISPITSNLNLNPIAAVHFANNIWIADSQNGLVIPDQAISKYPNGPYSNDIIKLISYEDNIIALPPAYTNNYQPFRKNRGFFLFNNGTWENFNSTGNPTITPIPEFLDITDGAYSASAQTLFLSSFGWGILKWDGQNFTIIDDKNSTLINSNPPEKNVLITALGNAHNELSAINFSEFKALHLYNLPGNSWIARTPKSPANYAKQIINLGNGTYWLRIANEYGGGIIVYDDNTQQELYLTTTPGIGNLPDNKIYDMALDQDGKMWVATEKGVVYYYNAALIMENSDFEPVFPIFDGQILFKDDKITALAIDGGNRIWMGNSTGLWLFANDGQEEISHFSIDNSPLPSNTILDIAINQHNGEVFVATSKGLVSYRGTSTTTLQFAQVKIFPNPVLAQQHDIISIEGVPTDANVSITDASGRLVYTTKANGNKATWQGVSSSQSLSTGIYFVFIANEDGTSTQVGKIAIIL